MEAYRDFIRLIATTAIQSSKEPQNDQNRLFFFVLGSKRVSVAISYHRLEVPFTYAHPVAAYASIYSYFSSSAPCFQELVWISTLAKEALVMIVLKRYD